MKRIICCVVIICLLVCLLPMQIFQASALDHDTEAVGREPKDTEKVPDAEIQAVHEYNSLSLNIPWSNIKSVGHQISGSNSCACYSLAYCRTMLDNKVHYWYEYNSAGDQNQYTAWTNWSIGSYAGVFPGNKQSAFEKMYTELCKGKPVVVKVAGRGSSQHFVAVVGFTNVSESGTLSESNFLVIDPVASSYTTENMGSVGYSLLYQENNYQVEYDTTAKTVGFTYTSNSTDHSIDVNGRLLSGYDDGAYTDEGCTDHWGTFDVYINGSLYEDDVTDFWMDWPKGTSYKITDIKGIGLNNYYGKIGSLSGTVGDTDVEIRLIFKPIRLICDTNPIYLTAGEGTWVYVYTKTGDAVETIRGGTFNSSVAQLQSTESFNNTSGEWFYLYGVQAGETKLSVTYTRDYNTNVLNIPVYVSSQAAQSYADMPYKYYTIMHLASKGLMTNENMRVVQGNMQYDQDFSDPKIIWRLEQLSDGSYRLINEYDESYVTIDKTGELFTQCMEDEEIQKFGFVPVGENEYFIASTQIIGQRITVLDPSYGSSLYLTDSSDGEAQCFYLQRAKCNGKNYTGPKKPEKPTVSYTRSGNKIHLTWNAIPLKNLWDERAYDVCVYSLKGEFLWSTLALDTQLDFTGMTGEGYLVRVAAYNMKYDLRVENALSDYDVIEVSSKSTFQFDDVKNPKAYYYDAVYWAYNHKPYQVTAGVDKTHFGPDQTVTRAQAMVFFWAAKDRPKFKKASTQFVDVKKSDWYYKAVMWAVEKGITAGTDATHFGPNQTCNRGQILTFLYAAVNKPKTTISNPYKDVSNQWYKKAALWAYEKRIERGENGKFNAATPCTRASTVTYLYRFLEGKSLVN